MSKNDRNCQKCYWGGELKQGNFTARYLQDLLGVKARIIHQRCQPADSRTMPDGRIVRLFAIADVRLLKSEILAQKHLEHDSRQLMYRSGKQICRKCGAVIPWPGSPYCNDLACLPPSLAARRK